MKRQKRSCVIFGISKFGRSVAEELSAAGMHVLAVDRNPEKVEQVADTVTMAVVADVTDAREMEPLELSQFDVAIVATTGELAASVMGILLCKEAGVPYVLAKASDEMQAKVFEKLGADRVLIPEKEAAARVARTMVTGSYMDLIDLSDHVRIVEIDLPEDWKGKDLRHLDLRNRHHINVLAVRREGDLQLNWNPDEPLVSGDSLVVIADKKDFDRLEI